MHKKSPGAAYAHMKGSFLCKPLSVCACLFLASSWVFVSQSKASCLGVKNTSAIQHIFLLKDILVRDVARKSNFDFSTFNLLENLRINDFLESQKPNQLRTAATYGKGFFGQLTLRNPGNYQLDETPHIFGSGSPKILDSQCYMAIGRDCTSWDQSCVIKAKVRSFYDSHCRFGKVSTFFSSFGTNSGALSLSSNILQRFKSYPSSYSSNERQSDGSNGSYPIRDSGPPVGFGTVALYSFIAFFGGWGLEWYALFGLKSRRWLRIALMWLALFIMTSGLGSLLWWGTLCDACHGQSKNCAQNQVSHFSRCAVPKHWFDSKFLRLADEHYKIMTENFARVWLTIAMSVFLRKPPASVSPAQIIAAPQRLPVSSPKGSQGPARAAGADFGHPAAHRIVAPRA